jgi:DNA-binding MarR family transcriptional regulator
MTGLESVRRKPASGGPQLTIDLGHFPPYLVSRLHTHFQGVLLKVLKPHGLLVADWRTLVCLTRRDQAYIGDVVRFTSLPQATASRSIKRLRAKGLLLRKTDAEDRRASLVRISPAGRDLQRQLIGELRPAADAELHRLLGARSGVFLELLREAVKNAGLEVVHDLFDTP